MSATLSNYGLLILRLLSMLVLTRGLFTLLPRADYGFWALLWSIFAYALLLDFGLGTALQKYTTQWRSGHMRDYGAVISTSLLAYSLMGLVLALSSHLLARHLGLFLADVSPADLLRYQQAFTVFGWGTALLFPTGACTELLRGLEAIVLRNGVQAVGVVLHLGLSLWALAAAPDPLLALVWISLLTTGAVNLALLAGFYKTLVKQGLRISWCWPQVAILKELFGFSLFAWIITLTNLIIFRTDQLVISGSLGLAAVAGYQIVQRIVDMYRQYTTQLHDVLGPQTARHFQQGNHTAVVTGLVASNRWVTTLVGISFVPLCWGLPLLLDLWLGLSDPSLILSGRILLVAMAFQIVLRSTATQVLLMCQRERALMSLAVIEALANLVLSVWWVQSLGILGVALGTLVPSLLVTSFGYVPLAARFVGVSSPQYLKQVLRPMRFWRWGKRAAQAPGGILNLS